MKSKNYLILLAVSLVVSCAPISSNWSCKSSLAGTCRNIGEIDNNYAKNDYDDNNIMVKNNKTKSKVAMTEENITSFNDYRSKEKVSRVMFSPYIDEAGNRHDKSVVYFLEEKAEWRE